MQSHNKMMAWSCFFIVSAVLVFVRAKIGEKCQAHNYLACNLVAILLGQGTKKGLSGNLVGISINLCKSIQKELFINDTP